MKKILLTTLFALVAAYTWAITVKVNGLYYEIDGRLATLVRYTSEETKYTGDITIPATVSYSSKIYKVTAIGKDAFSWCDITSVSIPNSVISIGNYAFGSCTMLTEVKIPDSVTEIGTGLFYDCTGLTSAVLSKNLTAIPDFTFDGCENLTTCEIPNKVTRIGEDAFRHTKITKLEIPNTVTYIGRSAFIDCDNLTSIVIPNSVTEMGTNVFNSCEGVKSITISNNLTEIPKYTFASATGLAEIVTIPSSISFIGEGAFEGYPLDEIIFLPTVPPTIQKGSYSNTFPDGIKIYVPKASLEAYKAHDNYATYTILSIEDDLPKCATPVITKSGDKWTLECETEGVTYTLKEEVKFFELTGANEVSCNPMLYLYVYANKNGMCQSLPALLKCAISSASSNGDVDGNGTVNIADVTKLVNIILKKDN